MKKINQLFLGITGIWIGLAIFFGFFDLEISKLAINYKDTEWAILGAEYGNKVNTPLLYLGITILVGSIFDNIKTQKKIGLIMIIYSILNLSIMIITDESNKIFSAQLLVVLLIMFVLLTHDKNWRDYISIGISLIILIIFLNIIVEIMKFSWGRVRFNNLKSEAEFTQWFIINGNGSDYSHQSFPSGHTAIGWSFLPFLFLLKDKEIKQRNKYAIVIFVIGFGLFVAISRVLAGEHYASDVLFSTVIASLITIILYKALTRIELNRKRLNVIWPYFDLLPNERISSEIAEITEEEYNWVKRIFLKR